MSEMKLLSISPSGLSKHLVGDTFEITAQVKTDQEVELALYTNLNRSWLPYHFDKVDEQTYVCRLNLTHSGFFRWQIKSRTLPDHEWSFVVDKNSRKIQGKVQVDPEWLADAVVYNVFVRFFKGKVSGKAEITPGDGGTFDDVKDHLDDLKKMNINTLYLNPIHLIGELYRKYNAMDNLPHYLQPGSPYSIKDYKSIDPELTYDRDTNKHLLSDPQQEFRDLVNAAHDRGMHVIMDLVFNHTAHDFIFQRIRPEWYLYKENITDIEAPYLYPEDMKRGKPWGDPKHTMAPYDHGVWWDDAAQLNWEYMIPSASNEPPKNTSLKEMWEYFKSIPKYWIRHFGVDGFRCDIAYRVPSKFWKECIAEARLEAHRAKNNVSHDVVFIAEAYTNDLAKLQEAGFSAVYGDYSNKLHRPNQLKGYLDYMYNIYETHFPHNSKWFIFPESHDFGRTPQKVLGESAGHNQSASLLANQSRWLLTATLPGIPLIFNGFEKIEWQPVNLFSYGAVDWERDTDLRKYISKVNHIRHRHKALQRGRYQFLETNQGLDDNTQIFSFLRQFYEEMVIVVVNMDVHNFAGPAHIYLPEEFSGSYKLVDLLTDQEYERQGRQLLVELHPGESHIFQVLK